MGERAVEDASRLRTSINPRQTEATPDLPNGDTGASEDSEEEEG